MFNRQLRRNDFSRRNQATRDRNQGDRPFGRYRGGITFDRNSGTRINAIRSDANIARAYQAQQHHQPSPQSAH